MLCGRVRELCACEDRIARTVLKQQVGVEYGQWGKVVENLGGMVGGGPEGGRGLNLIVRVQT